VLREFERLFERGAVLGAMAGIYQRCSIQEESLHYEWIKQTGGYPPAGVTSFNAGNGEEGGETS
jgi:methylmalonyl-CoA mutase